MSKEEYLCPVCRARHKFESKNLKDGFPELNARHHVTGKVIHSKICEPCDKQYQAGYVAAIEIKDKTHENDEISFTPSGHVAHVPFAMFTELFHEELQEGVPFIFVEEGTCELLKKYEAQHCSSTKH